MEKRSDLLGPSPYPAEQPQRENDLAQDYTQDVDKHDNAPGEEYLWVCDGKHILVGPKGGLPVLSLWRQMTGKDVMEGPYAHGVVEVVARWNAEWMVRDSNIGLHLVDKMLRKYSKDMGWRYRAITDEGGMPFEGFKTGASPGIGEINPGLKDWKNNEWSDTEQYDQNSQVDYYGEQDPTDDEPAPGPRTCSECGTPCPDYNTWRIHVERSHINPERRPNPMPMPVIDMDQQMPADFNTLMMDKTVQRQSAHHRIAGPIPFIYDIEQDRVFVGHPGERHSDIAGRFTPGGIIEGIYKPDGKVEIRTDTDMPYTVRHLIELWYAMHPELPVKGLFLLVGQEQYKLASSNIGHKVRNLAFTDPAVQEVYGALAHYGNVFVVGGAVRDVVLGKLPKDFDLMVQGIDANTLNTILRSLPGYVAESVDEQGKTQHVEGKAYGIFRYVTQDGHDVEVALPRSERSTGDSNADFDVQHDPFMPIEQDMGRRDFTCNSMAVNLATGDLIDPYNGVQDTREGVLRTTNEDAFSEDPLRIVRALTAMSRHGFHLDPPLEKMLKENAHRVKNIKEHRTHLELDKLFEGDDPTRAMQKAMDLGVMHHLMPEVAATQGFDQKSKYHRHLLDHHLMNVLRSTAEQSPDKDLRLAALLHDIGKPASQWMDEDGHGHYYYDKEGDRGAQHADVGAEMAHSLLSRLNYPGKRVKRIQHLIQHHMFPPFSGPNGAKKFLKNVGSEHAFDLLKLRRADGGGKGINEFENTVPVELQEQLVQNILHHNVPYSLKDLAVTGHDLMEVGIPEGPGLGKILNQLADAVLENPALNNPETLKALAQQWNAYNAQPTHMPQTVDAEGQPLAEPTDPHTASAVHPDGNRYYVDTRTGGLLGVEANILDPIHEELDPEVFDNHDQHAPSVKPRIIRWVQQLVFDALRENAWPDPSKYLTMVLTGSLTTYQWSHHSDFDVSLWVDISAFPTWARADMIRLMVEQVDGTIVPGTTHPIQCYVVAPDIRREQLYKPGLRSAYDLDTQKWIVKPEHNRTVDVERDMPALIQTCHWVEDKMRLLLTYHPDAAKIFWDAIHHARQRDMRAGKGDYAESNVIYKWLANRNIFPLISSVTGEYIASYKEYDEEVQHLSGSEGTDGVLQVHRHEGWSSDDMQGVSEGMVEGEDGGWADSEVQSDILPEESPTSDRQAGGEEASSQTDTGERGGWSMSRVQLQPLSGGAGVSPSGSDGEAVRHRLEAGFIWDREAKEGSSEVRPSVRELPRGSGGSDRAGAQGGINPLIAEVTGEYIASARMEDDHGEGQHATSAWSTESAESTPGTPDEEAPSAEGVWSSPAPPGSQPDPGNAGAAEPVGFQWPTAEGVLALGPIAVDNWQGVRDPGLVDAAIGATMNQHYYGGVNDAFELAAHLINNIQRQQGIVEGNKRTAVATGIAFLMDNGYPEAYNLLQDEPLPMGEMMDSDLPFSRQVVAMAEGQETPEQLAGYMRRHVLYWHQQGQSSV